MANEEKDKGNKAMSTGDFTAAIEHYGKAIELDPSNYLFYSNRSAAYASLKQYEKALEDADKTIELNANWAKGYSRKGTALCYLDRFEEAKAAYQEGLAKEPGNELLKQGLAEVESRQKAEEERGPDIGKIFAGLFAGDFWMKLRMHPATKAYLDDPSFVSLLNKIQQNPSEIAAYLQDPRVANVMGVLMGFGTEGDFAKPAAPKAEPKEEKTSEPKAQPPPQKQEQPKKEEKKGDEMEVEKELTEEQKQALQEKELGNAAYKKKDFETAIQHYTRAMELDPDNMSCALNTAAAYFEMHRYDDCIKQCEQAIELGKRVHADYQQIAKAYARIGNAYMKQEKYAEAVAAYNSSITECRTRETLNALQKAERLKKEKEAKDYVNPEVSLEEKSKGNECFREGKYPEAIAHYTEAIKRNPTDHALYSNRAACYTKLGEYPLGLKDCDKCIELCPTFVKGYTRKGHIQYFMKQYHKCLETYDQGLKYDPDNAELAEGIKRTIEAINKLNQADEKEQQKAAAAAAQDPEIQQILRDPVMARVLSEMQSNPRSAQGYLQDPQIAMKLQKLIAAGIVKTR